ncbi:hypothetical protein J6590_034695 [Homalodisca vitripennis]|nr:hypothetical protein J6590_094187 [Homalodisca vitripennis]KAG8302382.1 hypothetical protein J6590_034695 [Homalodisca vitripennis]
MTRRLTLCPPNQRCYFPVRSQWRWRYSQCNHYLQSSSVSSLSYCQGHSHNTSYDLSPIACHRRFVSRHLSPTSLHPAPRESRPLLSLLSNSDHRTFPSTAVLFFAIFDC